MQSSNGSNGDLSFQESSSQSSSVDNGDPQTPSPKVPGISSKDVDPLVSEPSSGVPSRSNGELLMDAHMARILHSLQLSANKHPESSPPAHCADAVDVNQPSIPAESRSAVSKAASQSQVVPEDQWDWSMRSPQRLFDNRPLPSDTQSLAAVEGFDPLSHQKVAPQNALALHPTSLLSTQSHPSPEPLSAATQSSMSGDSGASSRARSTMSRRSSTSTADLSPYLSKRTEMPVSGKQLKQLALLESVADESARMTPVLGHRASQVFAAARSSPVMTTRPPGRPIADMPSPALMNGNSAFAGSPVAYASSPRTLAFPPPQGLPAGEPHLNGMNFHSFQERPRTSAAMRPFHGSGTVAGNRASMDQSQLYAMMSRPRTMIPSMLPGVNHQPPPFLPPPTAPPMELLPPHGGLGYARSAPGPHHPLHLLSNSPSSFTSPSVPPSSSANLLSILNASPNGVPNGMGP
jgi:mRNA-decapping enzyme subunit 2